MPVADQAAAKLGWPPIGAALLDLGGRKKQRGARTGQVTRRAGGAQLRNMRAAYRAAVGQCRKPAVDGQPQHAVAGEIDIHARCVGGQRVERVIADDAVVDAQALTKPGMGGRGEPHHLDARPQSQPGGGGPGGLAGRAGQQHRRRPGRVGRAIAHGAKKGVVGQHVVNQPGGQVQRAQQGLQVFAVGGVERVLATAQVLVVHSMQGGPVRRCVAKAGRAHLAGLQHRVGCHGPVAVQPFAQADLGMAALHHLGKAPDGDAAPVLRPIACHRIKLPVVHRRTKCRIGDVVGGERKPVDAQADFTVLQRRIGGRLQPAGGQMVFLDQQARCAHRASLCDAGVGWRMQAWSMHALAGKHRRASTGGQAQAGKHPLPLRCHPVAVPRGGPHAPGQRVQALDGAAALVEGGHLQVQRAALRVRFNRQPG